MSGYIFAEAQEGEGEEFEYNEEELKKLKNLRRVQSDSSEDEDDEEKLAEENKGFINDEEEEEEEDGSGSDSETERKRKREDDDDLDEDDLDLIEENIGVKIDRKRKYKRFRRIEDEDSDAEEENERTKIENEIFDGSGDEEESEVPHQSTQPEKYDSEDDGEGSFIDDGKPMQKTKRKPVFKDEGLEAARDIFGCDFDYEEFEQYEDGEEREEDEDNVEREVIRKPKGKRKSSKKSIYEIFEPSDLERGHLTSQDSEIRKTDFPERFQLRQIPVTSTRAEGDDRASDTELRDEADWIYYHAFCKPFISNQDGREEAEKRNREDNQMFQIIFNTLDLIRNSKCEVPFIAFYRKEEVHPLTIQDLWRIYKYDEKWCQLKCRKNNFHLMYKKMMEYQEDTFMKDLDAPLPEHVRVIERKDIQSIERIEMFEEFNDYYKQFMLYYGKDQQLMREHFKAKSNQSRATKTVKVMRKVEHTKKKANIYEEEVETELETEMEHEEEEVKTLKKAIRRHEYELLKRAGVVGFARKFGLTPEQFGENVENRYSRYEVEQCPEDPIKEAENYLSKMCYTSERVVEAAVRMVGWELACKPQVRKALREAYFEAAWISVHPTPKGVKTIDEHHPLYTIKHLYRKPVRDLQGDQFLKIQSGVEEKVITFSLSDTVERIEVSGTVDLLDELKQFYYRDEFSRVVQDWNDLRGRAVEFAFHKIIEDLKRELTQRLLTESKGHVLEVCCRKLYDWLKVSPYNPGDFSDEEWGTSKGFRVFAIAYTPDLTEAAFGCCIDVNGDCMNYIRLPNLLRRRDGFNERDAADKEQDLAKLKIFIMNKKPHVIVVGSESREALMITTDIKNILKELEEEEQFPKINIELLDNELSSVYAASKKGQADFPDYPPLLRQAISLGRRTQDPLTEFSQLCNSDDEILNLKYHSMQLQLNPQELLESLNTEFVNRTNEVGVDLNLAVSYSHTQNLVQFVCGLGPRKARNLLKSMKRSNSRLENRNQLVMNYHMGPKVFINCAGFIKIDTNSLGDSDNYIEVLDSTRIHPEAYDWARKMAVDALQYEDEEGRLVEALEEILKSPERLSELDLEAFAVELHNQGFGQKKNTLYDICHELNHRYKDFRVAFKSPLPEEVFNMLTKETPETFYIGKLVQVVVVVDFIHRKPRGKQLDNANPVRNEETGLWQCPFCLKNDFPEISEVWNHFDAEDCPGQAIGVRVRLDNGISGFISIKNLSDKTVANPSERVRPNGLIHCRILKIDRENFSVELTSRTSDLQDVNNKFRPFKDHFYDPNAKDKASNQEQNKSEKKKTKYHKRVISHPSFRNIDYNDAEKILQTMEQGDALIRPSSKGVDHLTVTWKVTNKICQHIDVREQDKRNDFSLGQKLWIGNEEFEDLEEILARYVAPMAANMRQILNFKYYYESFAGSKEKAAEFLKEEKKKNPKTIHYIFMCVKALPGKFMLSYLPRVRVVHEYVSVLPEGFKFRHKLHSTLANLLKWFKLNFRNVSKNMGAVTPGMMTRTPYMGGTTPNFGGIETSAIQKVAQNMPSHLLHSLSAAASPTPFGTPFSRGYSNYGTTPYTPSEHTPYMTPYATPGPSLTQRYGSQTPSHQYSSSLLVSAPPPPASVGNHTEMDWQKAAAAWAQAQGSRRGPAIGGRTPRQEEEISRTTPRYSEKYDERRRRYENMPLNKNPNYVYEGRAVPSRRSVRSTPKTIHSSANMDNGGDQTLLYEE